MSDMQEIVKRIEDGDNTMAEQLLPLVYDELRKLASQRLSREAVQSLQTTELVNEVYLRLAGPNQNWDGRRHFFGAAAEAMRRILVDRARKRKSQKHGGGLERVALSESAVAGQEKPDEILEVNDLFDTFGDAYPEEAEVAKLRYFAGFTLVEVANVLDISVGTAHNYWKFAKAWLLTELEKK